MTKTPCIYPLFEISDEDLEKAIFPPEELVFSDSEEVRKDLAEAWTIPEECVMGKRTDEEKIALVTGLLERGIKAMEEEYDKFEERLFTKEENNAWYKREEATAMSPVKRYSITLEVKEPDGNQCFCELTLENLIGFSNTTPDSFWTQLLNNLADSSPIILKPEEMDSSRYGHLHGLVNL